MEQVFTEQSSLNSSEKGLMGSSFPGRVVSCELHWKDKLSFLDNRLTHCPVAVDCSCTGTYNGPIFSVVQY